MHNDKATKAFRSGFVNIIGKPNAGKSTLMNALVGERMSIISPKPQTTRHRILGILTGDHYQIVFSDTPGYVRQPTYKMHEAMNRFVEGTTEDADVILLVVDLSEAPQEDHPVFGVLKKCICPVLLVLNKADLVAPEVLAERQAWWTEKVGPAHTAILSALDAGAVSPLLDQVLDLLPEGPAYFPADQLTDRPERFFVSEIIREQIFTQYAEEIPYSCEVGIESFQETQTRDGQDLARIQAVVYVLRETQKGILLGKGGQAIKKLGTAARKEMEGFLGCKVFLEITVKVRSNWRDDEKSLQRFGYI